MRASRTWGHPLHPALLVVFGLRSSAFDIAAFVILRAVYGAGATEFRSAWFVLSTATELAPVALLLVLAALTTGYAAANELVKHWRSPASS